MLKKEPNTDHQQQPSQEEIKVAAMASGGKVVRPKDFDGKDNVRRFLHKFEQCAKVNGWTDDPTKLDQLSVSLSDKAYDFYMHLPEVKKSTYVELHKSLMAEFDSPGLQSDYALQLSAYRRREGQTTADFLHELQQLAERAYPTWGAGPRAELVKAQFINGLEGDLRTQLMLQAPEEEALEDLERRARRIEQVRGAASTSTSSVGRMETGPTLAQQVAELRDQVSAVNASMAELQAGVGRLTFGTGQRRARGQGVYRGTPRRGGLCFRCGQPGHYARNCRVPPPGGFQ